MQQEVIACPIKQCISSNFKQARGVEEERGIGVSVQQRMELYKIPKKFNLAIF